MLSPQSLNILTTFFLNLSVSGLDKSISTPNSSSRYNPSSRSYRKPENLPVYMHKHSNHPATILKELPKSIAKRISDLSSSENIFHDAIPVYKEVLQKSDATSDLVYTPK